MYIGNVLLLLNLPLIGLWIQLLKLLYNILFPLLADGGAHSALREARVSDGSITARAADHLRNAT